MPLNVFQFFFIINENKLGYFQKQTRISIKLKLFLYYVLMSKVTLLM